MSETYAWDVEILPQVWITLAYTGSGGVTCNPSACLYPSTCPAQSITIQANPASGFIFTNWTGDYTGTTNPATFVLSRNMSVMAHFVVDGSIGNLDEVGSTWHTGPFYPSQTSSLIARIHVVNNGYKSDIIYRKYMYKNTGGAWVDIETKSGFMSVGDFTFYDDSVTIPVAIQTCAIGNKCVRFGVKIWGTAESEPANPTLTWGGGLGINNALWLGLGIGALLLALYTHEKGMW